ncbi:MAG: SRPBCC domain-containing protein [Alphaproteobacteria bacterium]|nr:SRPBCC domain-containing protein [Alphaproteobacteria bacterium]MCB9975390.1 SRPBCC domain-containing protein [Rhodospirillales bacterium]
MNESANNPEDSELRLERLLDDTRQRVFEAWTDPDQLEIWCKPFDFTISHQEGDIIEGGSYRCCLQSSDGRDHWLSGVYREIIPNEKIVFTHQWDDMGGVKGAETLITVTFEEHEGQTKMTFRQEGFFSEESLEAHKGGWSEAFENLEEHLFTEAFGII